MALTARQVYKDEMKRLAFFIAFLLVAAAVRPISSQSFTADTLSGLRARSIGPAVTSGRVVDDRRRSRNTSTFYVGAASGGVWKTINAGTTWQPVFDTQGSYSIGCVTLDPKRPERRLGRHRRAQHPALASATATASTSSDDGGRSWTNVGPQELRAHRPHRHRSARLRHRLRRGAGAAVGAGRRPRPLQDHRRRQDLEAGAQDQRAHRRHRRRPRPAQPRRPRSPPPISAAATSGR